MDERVAMLIIRARACLTLRDGRQARVVHYTTKNGEIDRVLVRYRVADGYQQANWMKLETLLKRL